MANYSIQYAGPGDTIPGEPFFKWPKEHKLIVTRDIDPQAPALLINQVNSWLDERGERRAAWRTPRGETSQRILCSIKSADTALLFKLTFGGAR